MAKFGNYPFTTNTPMEQPWGTVLLNAVQGIFWRLPVKVPSVPYI